MKLEDLNIYQIAMNLGDQVWKIVDGWDKFEKLTVGSQIVKSVDSIAANIAEGFGRFHYKDAKNFYYYARGSLFETQTWIQKSNNRGLINDRDSIQILNDLKDLGVKLNNYIKATGIKQ